MADFVLTAADARRWIIHAHGLTGGQFGAGPAGVREVLKHRRCIQLDPLDAIGTNADLVAIARVDGIERGDVYRALLPGHGFEHFAKERCILPAGAFAHYRDKATHTPWWRHSERMKRLQQADPGLLEDVLAEVRDRGPLTPGELTDRGRVERVDWGGWKSTPFANKLALEILWVRCRIVVHSRTKNAKRYDVPERALPAVADAPAKGDFGRWALLNRVEASALLPTATGPQWGQLQDVRKALTQTLLKEGAIEAVRLTGTRRRWLAPAGFRERTWAEPDDRMRILGPLDPMMWDRKLIRIVFGFEYIWEVYKPASKRRWGWYVCPLLHRGMLVGRIEAHTDRGRVVVDRIWEEQPGSVDRDALDEALARLRLASPLRQA